VAAIWSEAVDSVAALTDTRPIIEPRPSSEAL
jgi:hypothetical protein